MKTFTSKWLLILTLSLSTASMYAMQYDDSHIQDYTQESDYLDEKSKKLFNLYVALNLVKHAQKIGNTCMLPHEWQNLEATDLEILGKELLLKHILPLSQEIQTDCYKTSFSIPRQATARSKKIITQQSKAL